MARLPKVFVGGTVAVASTSRYTAPTYVPTNLVSLIRQVHVSNPGAAGSFSMALGASDVTDTRKYDNFPIAGSSVYDAYVYWPLTSGQQIFVSGSPTLQLGFHITGDENVL